MHKLELALQRQADDFELLRLLVEKNNTNLEEFITLGQALKFGLKLGGILEKMFVWCTKCILFLGSIWGAWKFLVKEALARVFH